MVHIMSLPTLDDSFPPTQRTRAVQAAPRLASDAEYGSSVSGAICDVLEKSPPLNKSFAHQVIDSSTERLPMKLLSLQDVPNPHYNDDGPRDENTEESKIDATLLVQRKCPRDQNETWDDETHDAYRRTVEYLMFIRCGILAQQSREISLIQLVGFGFLLTTENVP
jgi:hypothetical protein